MNAVTPAADVEIPNFLTALIDKSATNGLCLDYTEAGTARSPHAQKLLQDVEKRISQDPRNGSNMKFAEEGRANIYNINPFLLRIKPGFNARQLNTADNQAHIARLALSIAENGVRKPLLVAGRKDKEAGFWVVDGHCRYLAIMHAINTLNAEIASIPVMMTDRYSDEADLIAAQILDNDSRPFTRMEIADVVMRLHKLNHTDAAIAKRFGMSVTGVRQLLTLAASVTPVLREMIDTGAVKPTLVENLVAKGATAQEAEEKIVAAADAAAAVGATRVMPKHLDPTPKAAKAPKTPKTSTTPAAEPQDHASGFDTDHAPTPEQAISGFDSAQGGNPAPAPAPRRTSSAHGIAGVSFQDAADVIKALDVISVSGHIATIQIPTKSLDILKAYFAN